MLIEFASRVYCPHSIGCCWCWCYRSWEACWSLLPASRLMCLLRPFYFHDPIQNPLAHFLCPSSVVSNCCNIFGQATRLPWHDCLHINPLLYRLTRQSPQNTIWFQLTNSAKKTRLFTCLQICYVWESVVKKCERNSWEKNGIELKLFWFYK